MEIDVRHIAKLAKLQIPEDKMAQFERELSDIVGMVEKLPALTGDGALLDETNTMQLREDVVKPSFPREEMLKNAPQSAAGCFVVPKTVE
ncbi:MAG: Asp-tRNA(Asn)/Glu-tRNA(Gln) amidotransferase subunit GatC [Pygmaiobacter massiliensis]|nr:Asp-tRNA(Asn)/Glu-tRNA(Gln) amidotransferase subunit GatC [Pygmaiobacter massiliensis]